MFVGQDGGLAANRHSVLMRRMRLAILDMTSELLVPTLPVGTASMQRMSDPATPPERSVPPRAHHPERSSPIPSRSRAVLPCRHTTFRGDPPHSIEQGV